MRCSRLGLAGVAALASGALIGGTTGTGEHVGFSPKTVTVGEGAGHAVVTVARDACENPPFILDWDAPHTSTNADRGTADSEDYEPADSLEAFASCAPGTGRSTTTFTVPILDDALAEEDETIKMSLSARRTSTNQTLLPEVDPDGTIVIEDDDRFALRLSDAAVDESAGVVRVPVERRGGPQGRPEEVRYWTSDLEARAGEDYTEQRGELTFADRGAVETVAIPIATDAVAEDAETFRLTLDKDDREFRATITIRDTPPAQEDTKTQTQQTQQQAPPAGTTTAATPPPAPSAATPRSSSRTRRTCVSKRRFTLALNGLRSANVRVDGKRMKVVRRGGKLRATIDLRGNPKGRYTVKIAGRDAQGRGVAKIRRYRTCAPGKGD